jgi:hypothetical protein
VLPPTVKGLRKQLASIGTAVAGTFLDTGKTRSLMQAIRSILSRGIKGVSADVRAKIKEMLDGIDQQLKDHSSNLRNKPKGVSAENILAGLGLTPEQFKTAAARLAQLGPRALVPNALAIKSTGATVGALAGAEAGVIVLSQPIYLDGRKIADSTTTHQQKRARRTAAQTRGRHAGNALGTVG